MKMSLFKTYVRVMILLLIRMEMLVSTMMITLIGVILMTQTHLYRVKLVAFVEEEFRYQPILSATV